MLCHSQVPPPPPLDCQPTPVVGREGQLEAESCGLGMRLISISKGHCSEEVGELHRQLEQARRESSVAPRGRELVLVRRELGRPSGSWRRRDT